MALFTRLTGWVLAKVRQRVGDADATTATLVGQRLSISFSDGSAHEFNMASVTRAVAVVSDVYVGTQALLILEIADVGVVQIPESCQGWAEVCRALDSLPGCTPTALWYPTLLAGAGERGIELLVEPTSAQRSTK